MSQSFDKPVDHPHTELSQSAEAAAVRPVFFDPANKRWPRLRFGMALVALIPTMVMGTLVLSILVGPVLPSLNLPSVSFLPHGVHSVPGVGFA